MVARVRTVAFSGVDVVDVEAQVTITPGLPAFAVVELPDKTVAEIARAGALGIGGARPVIAVAAHHGQPRASGCLEGGQPFRPADRACPARSDGRAARRRACRLHCARGSRARWL